jgi:cytochrome c2
MRQLLRVVSAFALAAGLAACGGQDSGEQGGDQVAQPDGAQTGAAPADAAAEPAVAAAAADAPPPAFAQCRSCHATEPGKNLIGPSLAGIFGTKAGDVPGYTFSTAMKDSGLTWDEATLDRFLKSPREIVPGTKMTYPGLKDDAGRADVIAYIKGLK